MIRLTMLHGTKENFAQCVVTGDQKAYFEALGFVDNYDLLLDSVPEQGSDHEAYLRERIKSLAASLAADHLLKRSKNNWRA